MVSNAQFLGVGANSGAGYLAKTTTAAANTELVWENNNTNTVPDATLVGFTTNTAGIQPTSSGNYALTAAQIVMPGSTSGQATIQPAAGAGGTQTVPNANGTFVLDTPAQTLTNKILATAPIAGGTAAGTGACATITTRKGGARGGQFTCTGTTGASTIVITSGITAPNGFSCWASDLTTAANILRQSAVAATTCTIAGTINANDVITFGAVAY